MRPTFSGVQLNEMGWSLTAAESAEIAHCRFRGVELDDARRPTGTAYYFDSLDELGSLLPRSATVLVLVEENPDFVPRLH